MTLGEVLWLFRTIKDNHIKLQIAAEFDIKKIETFTNYMELIKSVRNACAHSNVLYDFTPEYSIRKGPAMLKGIGNNQNLNGALHVVLYMLRQVSENRHNQWKAEIDDIIKEYSQFPLVAQIMQNIGGLQFICEK